MAVYRQMLKEAFAKRQAKNPRFSLRAFARHLGLDAGLLSKILAEKSDLSLAAADKVGAGLELSADEMRLFRESVVESRNEKSLGHTAAAAPVKQIDSQVFEVIRKLYHYAILELTFIPGFEDDPRWVARHLGITVLEADAALKRLKNLGLLAEHDGRWSKSDRHIQVEDRSHTTPALKDQQREILAASRRALERIDIASRCTTGMTMAIDPDKIPIAREMIDKFMFDLCEFLEAGKRQEVFQLSINLFPLSGQFD